MCWDLLLALYVLNETPWKRISRYFASGIPCLMKILLVFKFIYRRGRLMVNSFSIKAMLPKSKLLSSASLFYIIISPSYGTLKARRGLRGMSMLSVLWANSQALKFWENFILFMCYYLCILCSITFSLGKRFSQCIIRNDNSIKGFRNVHLYIP